MPMMAVSSSRQTAALLLCLVLAVATAQDTGRSDIRIVELINTSVGNISTNLASLHAIVTATTTATTATKTTTTPEPTTLPTLNTTEPDDDNVYLPGKLRSIDQTPVEGFWLMSDAADLGNPFHIRDDKPTIECSGNSNCALLTEALDKAHAVVEEVNGGEINDAQVDTIYFSDEGVVEVLLNVTRDSELQEILHDNIQYLEAQMEMIESDKADMTALHDKMKGKQTAALVLGLIALLLVFIGFTSAGYYCYQKKRTDPGVPEGLRIE